MQYRAEIDGLRALAVVPVILFHAGFEVFRGGFVGVDVFFVISGYLITTLLLKDLEDQCFSLVKFYERRARRILPALLIVVLCSIPVSWFILLQADMAEFARSVLGVVTFSSNIFFWRESGYFDVEAEVKPLLHTWSLAVEEQYYILFPLFLIVAWRYGTRAILIVLTTIFLISLSMAHWGAYNRSDATFYLLPTRAWELLIGSFAAFYLRGGKIQTSVRHCQWLSTLGLTAIVISIFAFDAFTPFPSFYALLPTLGTVLILLFARHETWVHRFLALRLMVGTGLLSYSLYLWHQPVLAFGRKLLLEDFHYWVPLLLVLTVSLAIATYFAVERPARFMLSTRSMVQGAVLATLVAALCAIAVLTFPRYATYANINTQWARQYQELSDISAARATALFEGLCHYTARQGQTADDFITQWSCYAAGRGDGAVAVPVAVAGDSNAADIANAFRQNGKDPTQMSAIGCSLVPALMAPYCRQVFDHLITELNADGHTQVLVLTNLFTVDEYSIENLEQMVGYWSRFSGQVVVLLDTPWFPYHYEKLRFGNEPEIDLAYQGLAISDLAIDVLTGAGFVVYSRNEIFCAINECAYRDPNGRILIADPRGEHLSLRGAQLFGEQLFELLARDAIWQGEQTILQQEDVIER